MKEDKLKQFISENRADFDDATPSSDLWSRVEATLPPEKKKGSIVQSRWIRIAAIFILGALSYATIDYLLRTPKASNNATLMMAQSMDHHGNAREVATADNDFATNVNHVQQNTALTTSQKTVQPATSPNNEFAEMQNYYAMQIQLRRNEIIQFSSDRPEIEQQINVEFASIDSVYNSMKNDLKDNMDNQEVIEAMILNYRVRLELLDVILQELKEKSATVTEKRKSYEI